MSNNSSAKHIWTEVIALKKSSTIAGGMVKKFHYLWSSFDDDDTEQPSAPSNGVGAASNTQEQCVKVIGLIYPLTEPFKQRALKVEIRVPNGYPLQPPEVYMKTAIRHPNIEKDGE